jgi:hypothetical protein
MVKKRARKPRKRTRKKIHIPLSREDASTEKILIENFVALQKVMTNLSGKFDNLATQISKMLNLFEISAKALAEKEFNTEKDDKDIKEIVEKLDGLLEQNKIFAKGLVLLHEKTPPEREMNIQPYPVKTIEPKKEIRLFAPPQAPAGFSEKYQKSISSEKEEFSQQPPKFKPTPR